jgi:hypothetical protein
MTRRLTAASWDVRTVTVWMGNGKEGRYILAEKDERSQEGGMVQARKNAGLKAVTLIAALNPVSQVLW